LEKIKLQAFARWVAIGTITLPYAAVLIALITGMSGLESSLNLVLSLASFCSPPVLALMAYEYFSTLLFSYYDSDALIAYTVPYSGMLLPLLFHGAKYAALLYAWRGIPRRILYGLLGLESLYYIFAIYLIRYGAGGM
jgi:hypothetical protein